MNKSGKLAALVSLATIFMVSCLEPEKLTSSIDEPDSSSSSKELELLSSSSVGISSGSAEIICEHQDCQNQCDGQMYNSETHFCFINECGRDPSCGDDPTSVCNEACYRRELLLQKCGGAEYDFRNKFCSVDECAPNPDCPICAVCYREEKVLERCGGAEYNHRTQFCFESRVCIRPPECDKDPGIDCVPLCYTEKKVFAKCGGREYNPDTEICESPYVICQNQITNCGGCKEYTDCQGNSIGQMLCVAAALNCFNPPDKTSE